MSEQPIKAYPTLGCCGLDCGLCPRYYTVGSSKCPGCCGPDFPNQHPSCPIITCCIGKKNLEVCAQCDEFPCSKLEDWDKYDSFITHRKSISNVNFIKEHGIEAFIRQQEKRIELLQPMLNHFDEGRSKSFYCIATVLLSIPDLERALDSSKQKLKADKTGLDDIKTNAKILKESLNDCAAGEGIELKLKKKGMN